MQPRRSPSRRDSPAGPPPCQRGGGLPAALQEVADVVIPLQHQVESLSDNLLLDLLRLQEGEGKHPWVHGLQDPHALLSPRYPEGHRKPAAPGDRQVPAPCQPWHHRSSRRGSHGGPGHGASRGTRPGRWAEAGRAPQPHHDHPCKPGPPQSPGRAPPMPPAPHQVLVEADEPRLAVVVEHQDGVDHPGGWTGRDGSRTGTAAVAASPQEAPRPPRKRGGGAALRDGSRQAEPGRPREDPAVPEQPGLGLGPTRSAGARGPGDARSRSSRGARAGTQPLSHCQGRGLPGAVLLDRGLPRPSPGQRQPPGQTGEGATVPRGPRRGRAQAGLEPGRRRRPHREDAAQARRRPRRQGAHQPQSDGSRVVPRRGGESGRRGRSPGRSWRQTTPSLKALAPLPAGVVVSGVRGHRRGLAVGLQCGRPEQTPACPGRGCCPPAPSGAGPAALPASPWGSALLSAAPPAPVLSPAGAAGRGEAPPGPLRGDSQAGPPRALQEDSQLPAIFCAHCGPTAPPGPGQPRRPWCPGWPAHGLGGCLRPWLLLVGSPPCHLR